MKLADFPKVAVVVQIDSGRIYSAALSLSSSFSCTLEPGGEAILEWLNAYAKGRNALMPPLYDEALSPFQSSVLEVLKNVPFGQTVSYSDVAKACGKPKASRAVGGACNRNPFPLFIPCHRVISANGGIGGFAIDLEIKKRLLEFEGKRIACP